MSELIQKLDGGQRKFEDYEKRAFCETVASQEMLKAIGKLMDDNELKDIYIANSHIKLFCSDIDMCQKRLSEVPETDKKHIQFLKECIAHDKQEISSLLNKYPMLESSDTVLIAQDMKLLSGSKKPMLKGGADNV